ncbi:MAG: hypothetical protein KGJ06_09865 [Pseudomonadota bacterium]|nr:hypothetical protein [Pseudomonadota bacterium]
MPLSSYPYRHAQTVPFPGKPASATPKFSAVRSERQRFPVFRTLLLIAAVYQIGGCIATPRFDTSPPMTFNGPEPMQQQLSYDDVLCCVRCQA